MLAAPPGSGKSFLIKQLISSDNTQASGDNEVAQEQLAFPESEREALQVERSGGEKISFEDEEVYVASLESPAELFGVFQRVQSTNLEGKKIPVVFFDEIDAEIGGAPLYAKFLAPMYDGKFYIGKERYFLGRCIFFFAGSTLSLEKQSKDILKKRRTRGTLAYQTYYSAWDKELKKYVRKQPNKLHDFMDRIDAKIPIPPICRELLGSKLQKEYQDLACMLVRKHFPNIKFIGKIALKMISDALANTLKNGESVRAVEKMIFGSEFINEDTFDLKCLYEPFKQTARGADRAFIEETEQTFWEVKIYRPPLIATRRGAGLAAAAAASGRRAFGA
jgi:ATPase family associated with various cellular activities (AAA)